MRSSLRTSQRQMSSPAAFQLLLLLLLLGLQGQLSLTPRSLEKKKPV